MRPLFILLITLLTGCFATTSNMRDKRADPSAGLAKRYPGECRRQFDIARKAIEEMRLDVLESSESSGEILARRGSRSSDGTMGDRLAIWFDPDGDACVVRVYARGQNAFAVGGEDWPRYFFRRMKLVRDSMSAPTE